MLARFVPSTSPCRQSPGGAIRRRPAFTIPEMLIAMAVTLLMMVALGRMFQSVGKGMQDSRASVEMSARLRTITFRLNDELSRCTAAVSHTPSQGEGTGYLVYYDGPLSDATMLLTGATPRPQDELLDYRASGRYGDYDDYLAFTAVASGDSYFTGVVPYGLMTSRYPQQYPAGVQDATSPVTITSKYAEIAYWVQPATNPAGGIVLNEDGLPRQLNLHRRVLLIRPDLNNINSGVLPGLVVGGAWPDNYRDLAAIFQNHDLSVHRVLAPNGAPSNLVAANSLSDLTAPHNRFGHIRVPGNRGPLTGLGNPTQVTSMPVLDLDGPGSTGTFLPTASAAGLLGRPVEPTSGLLSSNYTLTGFRRGDDIVMANVLAFDVKIFDSQAPVIIHVGADGRPGSAPNPNDPAYYGTLGSDDVVLTPNDPGFLVAIRSASPANFIAASRGAFVDLNYVYQAAGAVQAPAGAGNPILATNLAAFCNTPFSGFDIESALPFRFPTSLQKSGVYLPQATSGSQLGFYQPRFDTFTRNYEFDGFRQGPLSGNVGTRWSLLPSANTDRGNNGLDDNNSGIVDDFDEQETSAPFLSPLRALQITVRVEDEATRQVRQMVVTQHFVH